MPRQTVVVTKSTLAKSILADAKTGLPASADIDTTAETALPVQLSAASRDCTIYILCCQLVD